MFIGALKKRDAACAPACPSPDAAADETPPAPQPDEDSARGFMLIVLSVATSLDAFAVGMSLALVGSPVWLASAAIGVVAAILSFAGVAFACRLVAAVPTVSRAAEIGGAVVIAAIGAKAALFSSM
jgi:putative Mn2+ efflux pump MntP